MEFFKKYTPHIMAACNSVCKHICFILIFYVVRYFFTFFSEKFTDDELKIWVLALFSVTYFSTSLAFALYSKSQCLTFIQKNSKDVFKTAVSYEFFIDFAVTILFFAIYSVSLFYLPIIIIAVASNVFCFIFSRSVWLNVRDSKEPTAFFTVKLIAHLILSIPGLFLLFLLLSSLSNTLPTFFMVLKLVSYTLVIPIGVGAVLYVRAVIKMHSFIKSFKKFCLNKKIKTPQIKAPYSTVFLPHPTSSFEVELNGKIYSVCLLSFTNIFRPVIFKSDGYFYRISARALKRNEKPMFFYEHKYDFESTNPKLVIITSSPYVVKLQEGSLSKVFDTGDICGSCKLFTPVGLFGAIERNTIHRKSFD